jgi:biotin transporter BioY
MEHRIGEPDYGLPSFFQTMGGFLLSFLYVVVLLSVHALGSWTWYLTPIVARAVCGYIAHCISTLFFVLHEIHRILFVYSCSSTLALRLASGLSLLACRLLMSFVYVTTGLIVIVIVVVNAVRAVRDLRNAWTDRYGKAEKTE